MRWPLLAALLLLSPGCAETPDAAPGDAAPIGEGAGGQSASAPAAQASPQGPSAGAPAPAAAAGDPAAPVTKSCDVSTEAGVAAKGPPVVAYQIVFGCTPGTLRSASGGPFRSALLEFAWENAAPTMAEVELAVFVGDDLLLVEASATSPIRVTIPDADLPDRDAVKLGMGYGGTGAMVQFRGTTHFSLFEAPQPPDGYTALS